MAVVFEWENALARAENIAEKQKQASQYLSSLRSLRAHPDYSAPEASILLADEKKFAQASIKAAKECAGASLFIVIGIGGSNLGTMAAYEFLLGKQANLLDGKQMLFADTPDPSSIGETIRIMKRHIAKKKKVVLSIVSKSGSTAETLANFEAIYSTLSPAELKFVKVYATTDAGSALHAQASKKGWHVLPIPPSVGGRFSVFSCVGLFPLAWAGIDVARMLSGASAMLSTCLAPDIKSNPALAQAALMHAHCTSGKNVLNTFIFSNDLYSYGLWWRQLVAESSGKCKEAPTPTLSAGSTDLHSQAQLYFGGPRDKAFRFVGIAHFPENQLVPEKPELALSNPLAGKSTSSVFAALLHATKAAFRNNSIPYWEITLGQRSEETLGALLTLDMVSVMLFCQMLGVNAFDQPAVEEYKKEAKRLLA